MVAAAVVAIAPGPGPGQRPFAGVGRLVEKEPLARQGAAEHLLAVPRAAPWTGWRCQARRWAVPRQGAGAGAGGWCDCPLRRHGPVAGFFLSTEVEDSSGDDGGRGA